MLTAQGLSQPATPSPSRGSFSHRSGSLQGLCPFQVWMRSVGGHPCRPRPRLGPEPGVLVPPPAQGAHCRSPVLPKHVLCWGSRGDKEVLVSRGCCQKSLRSDITTEARTQGLAVAGRTPSRGSAGSGEWDPPAPFRPPAIAGSWAGSHIPLSLLLSLLSLCGPPCSSVTHRNRVTSAKALSPDAVTF